MIEGIACTFFAEQVFMLPVVILRRAIPARNIEIPLDIKASSFYTVMLASP
jgi:hypothetical protein